MPHRDPAGVQSAERPGGSTGRRRLGFPSSFRRRPARWLPAAALAALAALLWVVYIGHHGHFDIKTFLRAGAAVGAGHNPYPPAGTPEVYSGSAFVYPYLVAFPFAPLSALDAWAAEAFITISMIAVLFGAWLAGARSPLVFALVLGASCTITGLQMGTLSPLLFLGLIALWRVRDTPAATGVLAALLVYSKLFLAPVLLLLLLTRRWAALAGGLAVLGLLFGVGELTSPVGTHAYTQMLSALAHEEAPDGLSLTGLLMNVGLGLDAASRLAWAAALCLIVFSWRAGGAGGRDQLVFAGTVAAALVASPVVWSHYLLLLAAPLLVVAAGDASARGLPQEQDPAGTAPLSPVPPVSPEVAPAAFSVISWLIVTPYLAKGADTAGAAVLLAVLAGPPLLVAAATLVRRPGGRARALRVGAAAVAVGAAAAGACLGLRAVAVSPAAAGRVVGAYCTLLGVLAFLGWAWVRTTGRDARPGAAPASDEIDHIEVREDVVDRPQLRHPL